MKNVQIPLAWIATLLASSLVDIVCIKLTGAVPLGLLWVKAGLLGGLILLTWFWQPIRALRPFFVMLLAISALVKLNSWLLDTPGWQAWQNKQSFSQTAIAAQALEFAVALLLIVVLFILRKRRERFFLVRGDLHPQLEPIRWPWQRAHRQGVPQPGVSLRRAVSESLVRFGFIFTTVVIVGQIFMLIAPLSPSSEMMQKLLPLAPLILLLAAWNGFNEEVILRAAPIAPVYEVVGKTNAIWMAAILFGLAHFIGGIPSGILGVLITTLLGWFFGKCMLDSKGFFWPWLFHTLQDILPFTLMALAAIRQ